ncbi:MAG: ERAP1-like C-terminal domain-containing protein [Elusimicrobia bacterium]|nr:ERAP1-like C-terminal domain-containing protein [Elusimicrobiota bacterium]
MPSPAAAVPIAATPIMKNEPKLSAAKPSLDALTAGLAKAPAAAAETLGLHFDAAKGRACAACAGDEVPSGAPSASAPLPPSSSGRLSKTVLPRNYDLLLRLDPENAAFTGRVKISLESKTPVKQLVLHALDLSLTSVVVAGRRLDPSKIVVDAKAETVTFLLDEPLKGRADVEIEYSGKMNELMRGLYKSRGKNGAKDEAWSFTHLEPTHARRVLPSFDEPSFKASFALTMDVPAGLTPLSNMPPVSDAVLDGRRTVVFQKTPKMSSYLLAVFAARLESRTRKVGKTVLTVWAAPDQIAQADFALDAGENALKYLNSYFGLPYMLPKLDMVAAPDFASGAMENWGAILYRDASLLIDPKLSSDAAKRRVAEVVSHEIVHQWFGNLVTMGWWNDLWLNEAFATWLAYKVVDSWKPAWKVWDEFDQGKRSPLSIDALPGTRPVRSDAATPAEIQAMFDPMSYQKGGALLRMIEAYVGETAFRKGVQGYMRRFAYKNAEAKDLAGELERASGKPVRKMMDKWLSQGGVPVVSVTAEGRVITLTQERFFASDLKADTKWSIPVVVRYRLKGERKTRTASVLLDKATKSVTLPGSGEILWVYPNANETGYYRFTLDARLLTAALSQRNQLTPVERAGLLNNLWAQVRAGRMPVATFLDSLAAFRGDASRLIIEDAFGYLKTIRQELSETDADREALGVFATDFFGPLEQKLGWDKKKGESQEATLARPTVLNALALLAPKALDQAQVSARLKKYLADPSSIDSSIAAVVLTAAARRNDAGLFAEFRSRLAAPKTPEQKSLMLRALAEFSEPALLDRYLAMTLSDEIRAQDAWMPYAWLLANPATRERAWSFVKANWKALAAKVGPRGGTRVIGAAGGLVSAPWKAEVESFFRAPDNEIEMARKTLDQTLESIGLGLRFKEGQAPSFAEWSGLTTNAARFSAPGFKAFERMTGLWALTSAERRALLGVDAKTYARYKKDPSSLSRASLERISLSLGVYRRINEILSAPASNDWIKSPNKAFGGKSALDLMLRDAAGLREVRDYLLGVGGGWL